MNDVQDSRLIGMLRRVIRDCRKLYHHSANWMVRRHPNLIEGRPADFKRLMDDLHRGLLIKVYVTIVRADDRWTGPEKRVASEMIEHLWGEKLRGSELREAATGLFQQADQLKWEALVAPFVRYEPLSDSRVQVESVVMRLANLVAKCDGQTMPEESIALHTLQREIDMALHPANPTAVLADLSRPTAKAQAQAQAQAQAKQTQHRQAEASNGSNSAELSEADRAERLARAMEELDELIGLDAVKERIRSYTNFLRLQQTRRESGLNTMPISLHMTFVGNPGTGKTTVARIVGQILGALGTLRCGHVVETDRSGLVAEYAGQTGPKTNKLCDSSLGGILFIDEAYSLVDASGDDAYGREAVQTLLKRMEDDRQQLAVILAGYRDEMSEMIRSNPGLSSRVNTQIEFPDYTPLELGRIFEVLCKQNQYQLESTTRHRLLIAFHHLYANRDRHFGNGRLVRNTFEDTVRRLADRIADVSVLTENLLTNLTTDDVCVPGLTATQLDELVSTPHQLRVTCAGCDRKMKIEPESLGMHVNCSKCSHIQPAAWADVKWCQP